MEIFIPLAVIGGIGAIIAFMFTSVAASILAWFSAHAVITIVIFSIIAFFAAIIEASFFSECITGFIFSAIKNAIIVMIYWNVFIYFGGHSITLFGIISRICGILFTFKCESIFFSFSETSSPYLGVIIAIALDALLLGLVAGI